MAALVHLLSWWWRRCTPCSRPFNSLNTENSDTIFIFWCPIECGSRSDEIIKTWNKNTKWKKCIKTREWYEKNKCRLDDVFSEMMRVRCAVIWEESVRMKMAFFSSSIQGENIQRFIKQILIFSVWKSKNRCFSGVCCTLIAPILHKNRRISYVVSFPHGLRNFHFLQFCLRCNDAKTI